MFSGALWRDREFIKLWIGQTVSASGSAVTSLALPTAAILALHAGPLQVGLLAAFQRVPFVFLTLFAGVWLDRVRRRPVMIVADVARAAILAAVPLAAFASALSIAELYIAAILLGTCTVFFDVGVLAFLPGLIGREQLPEGYTKLDTSFSISSLVGPGLGGLLIQALTAPIALLANSVSYLVSAVMLLLIRRPEPDLDYVNEGSAIARIRNEIVEGLRWVFGQAILRSIVLGLTFAWFGFGMVQPLILVFAYRNLHFTPSLMGAILTIEGVSGLAGLWASAIVVRRLGLGRTMWVMQLIMAVALFVIPLARFGAPVFVITAALATFGVAVTIQDLNQVTLRQFLTPDRLQGRMNSIFRLFYWGSTPVASFLGGVLGDRLGASTTIAIGAGLCLLAVPAIGLSALGRLPQKSVAAVT
jgi:predicted MFS family arabinose efflux permease